MAVTLAQSNITQVAATANQEFVVGFAFDQYFGSRRVLLIRKYKPSWMQGRLNGLGGKIEDNETPLQAMVREFREECGIGTAPWNWYKFNQLHDQRGYPVHFFSLVDVVYLGQAQQTTTEELSIMDVKDIMSPECLPNVWWLVPQALSLAHERHVSYFSTFEVPKV